MKFLEASFQGKNQFWRFVLMICAVLLASNLIGGIPVVIYTVKAAMTQDPEVMANIAAMNFGKHTLIMNLFPFMIGLLAFILLVFPLHKRPFSTVVNGGNAFRWKKFLVGYAVWIGVSVVYLIISMRFFPDDFTVHNLSKTLIYVIIVSLLFIPFQAGFEEVLFRGYLMQGFTVMSRNRWMPLLITAVLFALMHSFNPEVEAYGFFTAMPQYLLFGLVFGIIAIMDDGIETSIGCHSANNAFLCIMVTNKDSALQTDAVFEQTIVHPWFDFGCMLVMSVITLYVLSRIYKWGKWKLLVSKVQKPEIEEAEKEVF